MKLYLPKSDNLTLMSWKMEDYILISSLGSPFFSLATLRAKGKEFRFPLAAKYVPNKIKNCGSFVSHMSVVDDGETGP